MRRVNTKQRSLRLSGWIFIVVLGGFGLLIENGRGQRGAVAEKADAKEAAETEKKSTVVEPKEADEFAGKVLVIPIRSDDLNDSRRFRSLRDMLAQSTKAKAVVFELNVSGSSSWEAHQRLLEELPKIEIPSYAFVNPSALVSGSILAVGTDAIYMSPVGVIGGAGLEPGEEENEEAFRRSYAQGLSVIKARARSLAISKGHRPEVVEAFIDADVEFRIDDEVISAKGDILTLTADEAVRLFNGKPLIAKAIAKDVADLLKQEGFTAEVIRKSPPDFLEESNRKRLNSATRSTAAGDKSTATDGGDEAPGVFDRRMEGSYSGKILVMKVGADALATGEARFDFMERTLKKANDDGAAAIIFEMDTPGGYAWYTQGLVLNVLQNVHIPTYTFVNTRAESAGAIIAMGTDAIYMRPAATIGSALTVTSVGDLEGDMKSKVDQMAVAMARNVAALKGHNPDIAEAFVVRTKEVVVDGEIIHPAGEVLNLNTLRATETYGGRPLLAKGIVNTVAELVEREGLKGAIIEVEPLGLEMFAHLVQKFSGVLLLVGLAGAWAELKVPGFGVPGVISLLAFGFFFFGNNLAGNLAGYELAVLLVLGLALVVVEIFIVPGTLIAGLVGGVMVIVALVLAMVDRVDFDAVLDKAPAAPAFGDLIFSPLLNVCLALLGSGILIYLLLRYLPDTPGMRWMVLKQSVVGGASLEATADAGTSVSASAPSSSGNLVGESGEALTDLRPAGKGRFGDHLLDISADGEFIDKGTTLKIVRHEGSLIVVEAV